MQNCQKLLEVMVLDNHLAVKEIQQNNSIGPPRLLASLVRCNARRNTEVKLRKHYFANPMSTFFLQLNFVYSLLFFFFDLKGKAFFKKKTKQSKSYYILLFFQRIVYIICNCMWEPWFLPVPVFLVLTKSNLLFKLSL